MKNRDTSQIEFHIPPVCQGQAVTYAYGADPACASSGRSDCIIRRRSCGGEPDHYERFEDPEWNDEYSSNLDFWNAEPELGEMTDEWEEDPE